MENLSAFRTAFFEEGYYTIPEAIIKIDAAFNLSIPIRKVGKKKGLDRSSDGYRCVYQHIRRELEKLNLNQGLFIKKGSGHDTQYSHLIWNPLVNEILYPWLCKKSKKEEYRRFEEWRNRQKEYGRQQARIIEAAEQMDVLHKLGDSALDKAVEYEVQKRKLEIIFDFIFSTYIKLDEELLRADIETDICLTDADSPSAHSLMVNERLQNPKNYYTVNVKKT